jgi:uncharacterized protein YegL
MAGEPLKAVEKGLKKTLYSLRRDPHALETVFVSVIAFAAKATTLAPLAEVAFVTPPRLSLRPGTSLGAALDALRESILRDVARNDEGNKGDYKPIVFILSDGQPTDDWEGALARLKGATPSLASVYAFGCGDEADFETLAKIADVCFKVESLDNSGLAKLFLWVTQSVQRSIKAPEESLSAENAPKTEGLEVVDKDNPPKFQGRTAPLYLHGRCSKTKKDYLMKYRFSLESETYLPEKYVPLPKDFFDDGVAKAPAVDSSLLVAANCPYCGNLGWGKCQFCGGNMCLDFANKRTAVVCPHCEKETTFDYGGASFEVDGSAG